MPSVELAIFILSCLFLVSLVASKASSKFGVPVLVLFLGVGMVFGTDGLGIQFENFQLAQAIGTFALCIILFSGGLDTKFSEIKPVLKPGVTLATLGVLLTALITGVFIWWAAKIFLPAVNLTFLESLLLASVMSSTDSASVFGILRTKNVSLKNNLRPLLELESGSNDPMAYMLTVTLIQLIISSSQALSPAGIAVSLVVQLVVGAAAGYFLGKLAVKLINGINLVNDSLYPVLLFTCGIFIFSFTYFIKGNGYLAVYIGGLVIGNAKFVTKRSSVKFFDGLAWLAQIIMFLTLGLLVNPKELLPVAIPSVIIGLFMIFAARPISVFLSMLPFRKYSVKDRLYVSWVGLRGAVPIVFAILPLVAGVPHSWIMFNIVFFITLISLLLQGSTLTMVADWLGLSGASQSEGLKDFDLEFSDEIKSAMTELTITPDLLGNGNRLVDMSLPDKTLAVMVKRGNNFFIPKGNTELAPGDILLVITDDEQALRETYEAMGISGFNVKRN